MIPLGTSGRPRPLTILAVLVLAHTCGLARAADPAGPGPDPAHPAAASSAGEEASAHFKRGLRLFDEGDYTIALVEFERAYQLAPNYRALYNIALVDVQLGRYADASRTMEQYLIDGGETIPAARKAEATRILGELKLRTATVDLSTNALGAEISLDGKPIDPARLAAPMLIDAGEHTLRASAPGYLARSRTLTLAGGDRAEVRLELEPVSQPQTLAHPPSAGPLPETPKEAAPHRRVFWPGVAATGALAAGAVVSGIVMLRARSDLTDLQDTPGSDAGRRSDLADRANTAGVVADVCTGLALVSGGISLYLSLKTERSSAPVVSISPRGVGLTASF